ncbi:MAG: lysozyme inhibitor LprI family protein [Pseudomonadota bacterium]
MTASSQVETVACLSDIEEQLVPALAVVFDAARASALELDEITERSVAVPALEAAQDAWALYRDAQCDYAGALFGGGSGTGIAIQSCRIEMTRARIKALSAAMR